MKSIVLTLSFIFSFSVSAKVKTKLMKVAYYKNIFGHVHQNASKYSTSLTTISCGYPVKVFKLVDKSGERSIFNLDWLKVKVGPYNGYINKNAIVDKRPSCFQEKYPKYFDALKLDLSEMFYWGKLYDHYVQGRSKVQ